jgi:hypothetical protein
MVNFRTQHATQGETSVAAGDEWTFLVEDDYRRLRKVDLVGDVAREIYVRSGDQVKFNLFGTGSDTVSGEGDLEVEVELAQGDEVVIEYQGSADVSDVLLLRTDRPIQYRLAQLVEVLDTNEV